MPRTRSALSPFEHSDHLENQTIVEPMQNMHTTSNPSKDIDPLESMSTSVTTAAAFLVFMVVAAGTLAVLSSQSAKPVVLTLLSLLAVLGVFFIFGLAARQIRLTERTLASDIVERIANLQGEGLLVTTTDGSILHANKAAAELLGCNELGDLYSLENRFAGTPTGAEALFRLLRARERQQTLCEEILLPSLTEETKRNRWFRLHVQPFGLLNAADYRGNAALWTITEITNEKEYSDQQIHHLRSELKIYRELPVGVCTLGLDGKILHINQELLTALGYITSPDSAPRHLNEIASRHGVQLILETIGSQADQTPHVHDLDFVTATGERWSATCYISVQSPQSDACHITLVAHPGLSVNGREKHEAFASVFRTAPFGIALVDSQGCVETFNTAFARLSGASFAALSGRQIREAFDFSVDPLGASHLTSAIDAAQEGKAEVSAVEVALGSEGEFARRIFVQSLGQGTTSNAPLILFITDATEERALGQKFAQSQKMEAIGKLAGGIAHDFNNVLTAIIGFSDLLLANHRPTDHAYKNIQNIRSSANHAAGLVKQLLAFSRRQTLEPEVLQLGELVTDLSVILNRLLGENIDLEISSGRDLWPVMADCNQLNQVIINLAVNARDAMPDGGRLAVRTKNISERDSQRLTDPGIVVGQYVMIEVQDTGSGMPPEVMAKIFEPFFTTKDVGKGTGLGLSTVYGIIKQTGGYVFVDSAPDEGTTFRVYLPRYIATEKECRDEPKPVPVERAKDLTGHGRVLIVEDEDAVRIFATEALRRQGYEVLQACDGLEALDVLEACNSEVDLVVSDVKMPEMDGPTLYQELRKTNPTIKFVFVSGYADDAFSTTLDADADYTFLQKPYTLAQIATVVKQQLLQS